MRSSSKTRPCLSLWEHVCLLITLRVLRTVQGFLWQVSQANLWSPHLPTDDQWSRRNSGTRGGGGTVGGSRGRTGGDSTYDSHH